MTLGKEALEKVTSYRIIKLLELFWEGWGEEGRDEKQ